MRCEKSKRTCPGYRDVFETKIRDETQSTINKFNVPGRFMSEEDLRRLHYILKLGQARQDEDHRHSQQGSKLPSPPPEEITEEELESFLNRLGTSLLVPVDQQASCYFLADFVLVPSSSRGFRLSPVHMRPSSAKADARLLRRCFQGRLNCKL